MSITNQFASTAHGLARRRRPARGLRPAKARLFLEHLEGRNLPSVSLDANFAGLSFPDSGDLPPDTCGAAGPVSYVETVNQNVRISNKVTGAAVDTDNFSHFFYTTGGLTRTSASSFLSDPIVVWDDQVQRFIIGDQDVDSGALISRFQIAVSKSATPGSLGTADWYFLSDITTETGLDADYPGNFGYNHNAFVFTLNMYSSPTVVAHVEVNALKISDLINGTLTAFTKDLSGASFRPTVMHDSVAGDPMWLIGLGDSTHINVEKMTNVLSGSATFTNTSLMVTPYSGVVFPKQPDGTAVTTNIDSRILKAAEWNGQLVATHSISTSSTQDNARWYRISVASGTPIWMDQGDVVSPATGAGTNNVYDYYPSIDINANGDIGMTFMQSGTAPGQYMSMYVTVRTSADAAGTMESPVLVKAGAQNYHDTAMGGQRAGDLSGISVDPVNGTSFWAANEYATNAAPNNWGTWIASFSVKHAKPTAFPIPNTTSDYGAFVLGQDGNLYENIFRASISQYVWQPVPRDPGIPLFLGDPSAFPVPGSPTDYGAFVVGQDGELYDVIYHATPNQFVWYQVPRGPGIPRLAGDPSALRIPGTTSDYGAFVRGQDGILYETIFRANSSHFDWEPPLNPGAPLAGDPAAFPIPGSPTDYGAFIRGQDGILYETIFHANPGQYVWYTLTPGVLLTGDTSVLAIPGTTSDYGAFIRGQDGNLYETIFHANPGQYVWEGPLAPPGVRFAGDPSALTIPGTVADYGAFVRGQDGNLYEVIFRDNPGQYVWEPPLSSNVPLAGDPSAFPVPGSPTDYGAFVRGQDGNLYVTVFRANPGQYVWYGLGNPGTPLAGPHGGDQSGRDMLSTQPLSAGMRELELDPSVIIGYGTVERLLLPGRAGISHFLQPLSWLTTAELDLFALPLPE